MSNTFVFLFSLVFFIGYYNKNEKQREITEESKPFIENWDTSLQGAWTTNFLDSNGNNITSTIIIMNGYIAETHYNLTHKQFIKTFGGLYIVDGDIFKITYEFNTADPTSVGKTRASKFKLSGNKISFVDDEKIWTRLDHGNSNDLANAWLITGRKKDGKLSKKNIADIGPRKTMKILSDTRFQWIAYHTETGKFFGTGGGTYTAKDGKYTENIEFFSRDSTRVGASLSFDYHIENGEWHHSGLSSKGNPIYEIWSPRP